MEVIDTMSCGVSIKDAQLQPFALKSEHTNTRIRILLHSLFMFDIPKYGSSG